MNVLIFATFAQLETRLDWQEVLQYYRLRFQIEFLYRDAKQHTGLNDC